MPADEESSHHSSIALRPYKACTLRESIAPSYAEELLNLLDYHHVSEREYSRSDEELDTSPQITPSTSHEQQVRLKVIEALTNMSVHLSTAEIDAVAGLLMLRRDTRGPCRFSSSSSVHAAGHRKRTVSGSVKDRVITATQERPRTKQIVDTQGEVVVPLTLQVPDSRSSAQTLSCSRPEPAAGQYDAAQYQSESTQVPSASLVASHSYHSQNPKADNPNNVNELYPRQPVKKKKKKKKCFPNASQPQHLKTQTTPPSTPLGNTSNPSSTNIFQETQHTTSRALHTRPTVTNQQAPASPNKPTLILTAPTTPLHQHQSQHQSQHQPQPPPSGSCSESQPPSQPRPRSLFPNPPSTSIPAIPNPAATTKPPLKKRKKYGTAYEVSRARQIQATGVPRLPGPCHSCARRQRQLDEIAAAAAAAAASNAASNAAVGAAAVGAAGGVGGGVLTGTGIGLGLVWNSDTQPLPQIRVLLLRYVDVN
ncbi:hypothetical protein B0H65DRAFT_562285 [Neurospora tetraspora]|uniref:Uncharacterized protein n=1 Tax=Neurospora tetraspora TaxID=94610 RepID=A0AAE0JN36_9PEZI|nr:hypothetical protein B0H65DRAFT_562285 [Neurospora tetraspora]